MGGREELFGFFLSADFGDCVVAPTCTTYQSPPLCPNERPRVKYLTVWGVGEEPQDSDDEEVCSDVCELSAAFKRSRQIWVPIPIV